MKINRHKENILNLTCEDALNILKAFAYVFTIKCKNEYGFKVNVNFDIDLTTDVTGETSDNIEFGLDKNKIYDISINIKDLGSIIEQKFGKILSINDFDFVGYLITLNHEFRHMDNFFNQYKNTRNTAEDCRYLAVNYLTRQGSDIYYETNYEMMPIEIDAEQNGICKAYEYLHRKFPNADCEKLIADVVNYKAENLNYFIKPKYPSGYNTIKEINEAFDVAFEQSKKEQRRYDYKEYESEDLRCPIDREMIKSEWVEVVNAIARQNGDIADKMMASLSAQVHETYVAVLPTIRNIDFDPLLYFTDNIIPDEKKQSAMLVQSIKEESVFKDGDKFYNEEELE